MTFDIIVFEEDELADGTLGIKQHPENGVQAASRKELIGTYAMCGQKIKILREYGAPVSSNNSTETIQASAQNVQSSSVTAAPVPAPQNNSCDVQSKVSEKPKFFTIGNIQCKMDNGKLYQKQWVQVSSAEMDNYRIVSNTNNKIVPLVGKHLEKLTWVMVEDNDAVEEEDCINE